MKENKKINICTAICIIITILIVMFGTIFYLYHREITPSSDITLLEGTTSTTTIYSNTKKAVPTTSNIEYKVLASKLDVMEYYSSYRDWKGICEENLFVTSSEELKRYLLECVGELYNYIIIENENIEQYFNDDFFEENNLAIVISKETNNEIVSVIQDFEKGIINIEKNIIYTGENYEETALMWELEFKFICLDNNIKNVEFDIYKTETYSYRKDYSIMLKASTIITLSVITIVAILVREHNKRVGNEERINDIKAKKIILAFIIIILIIIAIFSARVFLQAMNGKLFYVIY